MSAASEQLEETGAHESGVGRIKTLQQIVARKVGHDVGYDEAQEIATRLIEFYELLAEDMDSEPD